MQPASAPHRWVDVAKILAFIMATLILLSGIAVLLHPSFIPFVTRHFDSPGPYFIVAAIRVFFGIILISVASSSRLPKFLRIFGWIILISGFATAFTGAFALDQARAIIDWWVRQGDLVSQFLSVFIIALGAFIAYACLPPRHAHSH